MILFVMGASFGLAIAREISGSVIAAAKTLRMSGAFAIGAEAGAGTRAAALPSPRTMMVLTCSKLSIKLSRIVAMFPGTKPFRQKRMWSPLVLYRQWYCPFLCSAAASASAEASPSVKSLNAGFTIISSMKGASRDDEQSVSVISETKPSSENSAGTAAPPLSNSV
jgi:hypothetical protein